MGKRRIRSKKHSQRRRQARRKRLIFYSAAALVLAGLFIGLTHLNAVQINDIVVKTEASHLEKEQISMTVAGEIRQPLWLLLRRDNILLLPRREIKKEVLGLSDRIRSVDVDITGLQRIRLEITNRQPVAEVCPKNTAATSTPCRLVDKSAFVFARSDSATTSPKVQIVSENKADSGSQLLPTRQFQNLQEFLEKIAEIGFTPTETELRDYGDVFITAADSQAESSTSTVQVKLNIEDDVSQVFRNLETVVRGRSFVSENSSGEEVSVSPFSLEYIDLRFENKVFYK